jgi:hypothetical protein
MNEDDEDPLLRLVVTDHGNVHCMHCGLVIPWQTALVVIRPRVTYAADALGAPYIVSCSIDCLAGTCAYVAGRRLVDPNDDELPPAVPRPRRRRTLSDLLSPEEMAERLGIGAVARQEHTRL